MQPFINALEGYHADMEAKADSPARIPLRARLPWFWVWIPALVLLYLVFNGGGYMEACQKVWEMHLGSLPPETEWVLKCRDILFWPGGWVTVVLLAILAGASWGTAPHWSAQVRWICYMVAWLIVLGVVLVHVLLIRPSLGAGVASHGVGWWLPRKPTLSEVVFHARRIWKPHWAFFHRGTPSTMVFLDDPDRRLRGAALYAFTSGAYDIDQEVLVATLLRFVDEDPDTQNRVHAAITLIDKRKEGKLVGPHLVRWLENLSSSECLGRHRLDDSREWIFLVFERLHDRALIVPLAGLLWHEHSWVQEGAARMMGHLVGVYWAPNTLGIIQARAWWEIHQHDAEFAAPPPPSR